MEGEKKETIQHLKINSINLKLNKTEAEKLSKSNNSSLKVVNSKLTVGLSKKSILKKKNNAKIAFLKFKNNKMETDNPKSITFRVVGPNIDSTVDQNGRRYSKNYFPRVLIPDDDSNFEEIPNIGKYNKDITNKNRFNIGNYGKSRITRF